jgi:hypothetical protein
MMPYQAYQVYQAERPKSAAEIRRADEQLGHLAENMSWLWQRVIQPVVALRGPAPRCWSAQRPVHTGGRLSRNAAGPSCASALW